MKPFIWQPIHGGHLAISHRPRRVWLSRLRAEGVTHILTLQSAREGARLLGAAIEAAGLDWLWLPLEDATPPAPARTGEIARMYDTVGKILEGGGRILVHCSAGIHRTGMVTHGLLRFLGFDGAEARAVLARLRPMAAVEVGEHRLAWGERFAWDNATTRGKPL